MNLFRHVIDIENSYWQNDDKYVIEVAQVLIKLSEDSETDSDIGDVEVKECVCILILNHVHIVFLLGQRAGIQFFLIVWRMLSDKRHWFLYWFCLVFLSSSKGQWNGQANFLEARLRLAYTYFFFGTIFQRRFVVDFLTLFQLDDFE